MVTESRTNEILRGLRSLDPGEAWEQFMVEYASLIFQVVRHFERDPDHASDCFQFTCERLCENRFRRLGKFKENGAAKFSTWLRTVTRNLCLDWRRKQFGRRRVFRSIARLSSFDQEVFRCVHERGASIDEALGLIVPSFPQVTARLISESVARINQELSSSQLWLLSGRNASFPRQSLTEHDDAESAVEVIDQSPNPVARAAFAERRALLTRVLRRLPNRERLMLRLRFEEDLTLEQIATLLELGNAQRADRQIKEVLSRLRADLAALSTVDLGGKNSDSSVKVLRKKSV